MAKAATKTGLSIGERLAQLREQHDPPWTQEKAARACDMSLATYWKLENGTVEPRMDNLRKLARGHGLTLAEFFDGVE